MSRNNKTSDFCQIPGHEKKKNIKCHHNVTRAVKEVYFNGFEFKISLICIIRTCVLGEFDCLTCNLVPVICFSI